MVRGLRPDRRRALKDGGDEFVATIAQWKAIDGVEDEFYYVLPEELRGAIRAYRRALLEQERIGKFSPAELSVIAASFRRGRKAMMERGLREVADQLYVFERQVRMRIDLSTQRYDRFATALVLRLASNFGTSPGRFVTTALLTDIVFALLAFGSLDFGRHRASLVAAFYWSTITLTTLGYGDIVPIDTPFAMLLATSEALLGAILMGVLLHLLVRRLTLEGP